MTQIGNIEKFLVTFSDERLAMLQAHAESGRLSFFSCCCLVGSLNADHPLRAEGEPTGTHLYAARWLAHAAPAEQEFLDCGDTDQERIAVLLPLIAAEWVRRRLVAESAKPEEVSAR